MFKKIGTFTLVLMVIALAALAGMMISFKWYIIFPLAIFGSAFSVALKRLNIVRW